MVHVEKKSVSRRRILKSAAATALAVGTGPAFIIPGRAQKTTLKILKWKHFVPGFDRWFNETDPMKKGNRIKSNGFSGGTASSVRA